ncbi:MAG: TonB-dependent receptor [bacterium]|nr:TonB-dependent receptor [bacterium]
MKNIRLYLILLFLFPSISFAENINIGKTEDYFRFYTGADITDLGQPGLPCYIGLLGLSNNHTLLTLDGIKINSSLDGTANVNHIPIGLIKNIEIKKGISSGSDGTNAFGGSINIFTAEADNEIPYTRLYSRWGSSGMENYGFNFNDQNGSFRYSIFADKLFSHGFGDFKKYNKYNAVNFYSKMDWYYDPKTWFTLTAGKYEDNIETPYSIDIETDKNKDKHIQLKYETHQAKTALKIRFYENDDWLEQLNSNGMFTFNNSIQGNEEIIEQNMGKYHLIRIGKEHHWNRFYGNYTMVNSTERVTREDALYYEDEINFKNMAFLIGLRHDNNYSFAKEKSPRFKINYQIQPGTALFLSAGQGISFPNTNDLYLQNGNYKGNPGLNTEKGWVYTAGLKNVFSDFASVNLTGHFADINNFILWDYDPSLGYFQPRNISSVITKGAETEIKFDINENLNIQSIYTYLITEDKETKMSLPYRPENKVRTNITYKSRKYDGDLLWIIMLSHEYQGIRYVDRDNNTFLSSFNTVNLNIGMLLAKSFTMNLAANNLLDNKYSLVSGYPMPTSNFWGGIVWEFWD